MPQQSTLPPPYRLVIDAWRAATDSRSLSDCVDRVAALLARVSRADVLTVWRLAPHPESATIEIAAAATIRPGSRPAPSRRIVTAAAIDELRRLARDGHAVTVRLGVSNPLVDLVAPTVSSSPSARAQMSSHSMVVAAIVEAEGALPIGVVTVVARSSGDSGGGPGGGATPVFTDAHLAFIEELCAPLATALKLESERESAQRQREALEADRRALLQRLDRNDVADVIVGAESGLSDVLARVEQVAPTDAPVLLLGETGVGKEVVARTIHARSPRARGAIVRVNCGAIPAGLIDSELFGHEKGSFTGAITTRKGWFERADGGTLFLDEIAELPLDAQVRLLRILQDGLFERVGAQRANRVDVRIVAATHRNLRDMVSQGRFREDLWYRLSVFPIEIPPLRARPEDIPALASHFAARAGMRIAGTALALAPDDVELLLTYPWPGNVRELAAVIERAAILGDGKRLRLAAALGPTASPDHSLFSARTRSRAGGATDAGGERGPGPREFEDPTILPLDKAMARHIERALRATRGRIEGRGGAAALLRINPHTLRARMRKLGVEWSVFRERDASDLDGDPHWGG